MGVQQGIEERLKARIEKLRENICSNSSFACDKKIKIKLSGDRTNVGKRLHVINVTFTILEEGSKAMTADGNHIIAIINVPENYENLAVALADIRSEVASLTQLKVEGSLYKLEWYLGGDWKFLACVCGLGAATSNHPCIWCKCPLYNNYDGSKEWSLSDLNKGARTVAEIEKASSSSRGEKFNVKNSPLFPSIPISRVIIDSLHLFLRISDNLINLLIMDFRRLDAIDKKKTFNDVNDFSKFKHMAGWEEFLNNKLKIPFNWHICKESKKLKWRDLTGPEKLRLFRNVDFKMLLPDHPEQESISSLWSKFLTITELLSSSGPGVSKNIIEENSKSFIEHFLKHYQTKHVIPYMHALRWHVPEFVQLYGKISQFTQQGLEKLNDKTTKDFFRSTNQRGLESLRQIMAKRNRLEYLEDLGCFREKRKMACSNCNQLGHNIKTCRELL